MISRILSPIFLFPALLAMSVAGCKPAAEPRDRSIPVSEESELTTNGSTNWPGFRGPDYRSQINTPLPVDWDVDAGVLWESELPGRGASSPIVFGDRIWLTAYDGYGLAVEDAGDIADLRHHLICFDRQTGKPLWQRTMTGARLRQPMSPERARHGFASSTPVTNGKDIFAYFGISGVFAFDCDGSLLWQRNLGLEHHWFGSSASLVLHGETLIVNASIESGTIFGLDTASGAAKWWIADVAECWSMPVIGSGPAGRPEMVVSSKNRVAGYDPESGEQLWHCSGIQDYVVSVPVIVDGVCYLTGGKEKQMMAIRLGGRGDVNETHKLWETKTIGANVSSPVIVDDRLYVFHDTGILQIVDTASGELVRRQRTDSGGQPFASPLLAGSHLYMPMPNGQLGVFRADDQASPVASPASPDGQPLMASIATDGARMYFRSDGHLYCVGASSQATERHDWSQPADHAEIRTIEPYNLEVEKGWSRRYLLFLSDNFDETIRFLLMPYQSVITDEQTARSAEIMNEHRAQYDEMRSRYLALNDQYYRTPANELAPLEERYRELETAVDKLNNDMRILVKKLFSEEQMQQHLDDAAAGKAHLKPGESKGN